RAAVGDAAGRIEGDHDLGLHGLAPEVLLDGLQALPLHVRQLAGDVAVLLVAEPLDDVDLGLELHAPRELVALDQVDVLEPLRADAADHPSAAAAAPPQ